MKPLQTLITALLIAAMAVGVLASGAEAAPQTLSASASVSGVAALDSFLKADSAGSPAIGSVAGLMAMLAEGPGKDRASISIRQDAPFVAALHESLSTR